MFNLPKLIIFALIGGAAWYGYRVIKREMGRVGEELDAADKEKKIKDITLEADDDGVYRPKDD